MAEEKKSFMQNLGSAAMTSGATVAGALAAGIARKKVSFLDTTMGKLALIIIGLIVISYSKSNVLKGVGVGIATNGALGFASSFGLAGVDGLGSTDGMGQIVQDENGMIYMVSGTDEFVPYELPLVAGLSQGAAFSGFGGSDEMARI